MSKATDSVLWQVHLERLHQQKLKEEGKFSWTCDQEWDLINDRLILDSEKLAVLAEEFGEVSRDVCDAISSGVRDSQHLKEELIQVAAVAVAWAESL